MKKKTFELSNEYHSNDLSAIPLSYLKKRASQQDAWNQIIDFFFRII